MDQMFIHFNAELLCQLVAVTLLMYTSLPTDVYFTFVSFEFNI
jgi:hypothetical protein